MAGRLLQQDGAERCSLAVDQEDRPRIAGRGEGREAGEKSGDALGIGGGSAPHGALLSGTTLVIIRDIPLLQGVDFVNNDASDAEVAEAANCPMLTVRHMPK